MFPKTVFTDETKLRRKTLSSKLQLEADKFTWESAHEMAQLASICQGLVKQFMHRKPIQMCQHSYSSPTPTKRITHHLKTLLTALQENTLPKVGILLNSLNFLSKTRNTEKLLSLLAKRHRGLCMIKSISYRHQMQLRVSFSKTFLGDIQAIILQKAKSQTLKFIPNLKERITSNPISHYKFQI